MIKLFITWSGNTYDYTNTLKQESVDVSEDINMPGSMTFQLEPVGVFTLPPPRAYVQLLSTATNKSLFTGFITNPPTRQYVTLKQPVGPIGTAAYNQRFVYDVKCVSDEYLLNVKAVPFIPAYINRTQGQILTDLAEILCPGFFDTSLIASGDLVPEFEYTPKQSWSEVAKKFADGSRYRYKVRDKQITFQPFGDYPLGIQYNEETQPQSQIFPKQLDTPPLAVPIVNDVTIIGDAEAGNNREDYFLGDGFTGNFGLRHKTFRGSTALLMQESWANAALNTQQWYLLDPGTNFDFSAGALNLVAGSNQASLGLSLLAMNNGLELAGGIQIDNGEFTFNDICNGIIGGLYTDQTYCVGQSLASPGAGLIAGFRVTSSSVSAPGASGGVGGITIQPYAFQATQGPSLLTKQNHNYVLQMIVTAPQYARYTKKYRTVTGQTYGGTETSVKGAITFRILDYDIAAATGFFYEPTLTSYTLNDVTLPAFAAYALVNNIRFNFTDSYTTIGKMPLGTLQAVEGPSGLSSPTGLILPMLPPGSGGYIGGVPSWSGAQVGLILDPPLPRNTAPTNLILGNGFAQQHAQYSPGNDADTLAFYAQTLAAAGTPIRLQSWESRAAVSRVQNQASITGEASIVGDDGLRSAIVTDLNPLPRTSEDCDNAALAFLADRVDTTWNGSYTIQDTPSNPIFQGVTGDAQWWPCCGRFLPVNAPARGILDVDMLVTKISLRLLDMKSETLEWSVGFGSDLYLEKVLHNFVDVKPDLVLTYQDKANPPNPQYTQNVGTTYLADLNDVKLDIAQPIGPDYVTVNVGDLWAGTIEVRRLDTNWGRGHTPDFVAEVTGPTFQLQRTQFDEVWYMRPVSGTTTSRRSKVIRVRYPRTPSSPIFVSNSNGVLQFNFNGDIRSIYGFELRTPPLPQFSGYVNNQVVLYQRPAASVGDLNVDILQSTPIQTVPGYPYQPLDVYAYFFNADWVYSDETIVQVTGTNFGDFLYPWATDDPDTQVAPAELDGYRNPNFGIKQQLLFDPDNFVTPEFVINGHGIINRFSATTGPPVISLDVDPVGGAIEGGGVYTVGVWAIGADGEATVMTTQTVRVPDGTNTNTITVNVTFLDPSNDSGWVAISAYPPGGWYGPNAEAIPVGQSSYTFTSVGALNTPVPDERFDHFVVQARTAYVMGANGFPIQGITGGVLDFGVPVGAISEMTFPPTGWVGRTATCYAKHDYTQTVPIWDVPILGVSGTASGQALMLEVDAPSAALLVTGDNVLVRLRATDYGPTLIGDSTLLYWKNVQPDGVTVTDGLTPGLYAGKMVFITRGTGSNQRPILILDNDQYSFTMAEPFPVTPDGTSEFVVINSIVDYEYVSESLAFNRAAAASGIHLNVAVDNAFRHFFVQVRTSNALGDDMSYMEWSPYRLIFEPGFQQGVSGFGNPQETFIVGFGPGGVAADIPASGTSNQAIEKVVGTCYGWDVLCEVPPVGADLIFDVYKYRGSDPPVSLFGSGPKIVVPDGHVGLVSGTLFGPDADIQINDRLQLYVVQVGSTTPGQRATVNLYWKINSKSGGAVTQ